MGFEKLDLSNRKRPGGRNMVLLYGFSPFEMELLTGAVLKSGIDEWIYVDQNREGRIINSLILEETDNQNVSFKKEKDSVILFNGTSQFELQEFVNQVRALVKTRPLIAMVTETSKKWKFKDLISELKAERFEMEKKR